MTLPPDVDAELERSFRDPERDQARALLPSEDEIGDGYERILLAILALAEGSLSALAHYSQSARDDWRDVLYWHEHPRDADEPKTYAELRERLRLPPEPEHSYERDFVRLPEDVRGQARIADNGEVSWPRTEAAKAINALADAGHLILGTDVQRFDDHGHTWEAAWSDFSATDNYRQLAGNDAALIEHGRLHALRAVEREETPQFGDWIRVSWQR